MVGSLVPRPILAFNWRRIGLGTRLGGRIFGKSLGCLLLLAKLFTFCLSIDYHTIITPCSGEAAPAKKSTATEAHKQVR